VVDEEAITRDPRFQALHRRKTLFLWGLMADLRHWQRRRVSHSARRFCRMAQRRSAGTAGGWAVHSARPQLRVL